ncbi:transcriptional repressor LexA [Thiotrichales bacterium 19S3-7]|nr:transcriptional repressor LexA [Thiotrichales bacterium 19S3-7]MCF6800672.1 transcriptional repressor LexA [Thiotrichales bacterium 19S3-11]
MQQPLTKKEAQLLKLIESIYETEGYIASYSELGKLQGVSKMAICKLVKKLREKGYLSESNHILYQSHNTLPLMGKIAAGQPMTAFEVVEQISLEQILKAPNLFLLEVSGDSMVDSGILDGDYVLIQQQSDIKNGMIVVALIDHSEATLKEIRINDDASITLIPHNQKLKPQTYDKNQVQIQGIYLGARFDKQCFKA